ncbi:MAG: hypothetical protein M1831_006898 [Alyxoria varia]|nr:MAG: hypothetical protein M1831_006898 [Alyxoria varia]
MPPSLRARPLAERDANQRPSRPSGPVAKSAKANKKANAEAAPNKVTKQKKKTSNKSAKSSEKASSANPNDRKRSGAAKKAHETKKKNHLQEREYACIPAIPWDEEDDDEDDGEKQNEEGNTNSSKDNEDHEEDSDSDDGYYHDTNCHSFKKVGNIPSSQAPKGHAWIFSKKAIVWMNHWLDEVEVRNPDNFGMHIYNDSAGWGIGEVMENQLVTLDRELKKTNPDAVRLWTLLQGIALWLVHEQTLYLWEHTDDPEGVRDIITAYGVAVIYSLNILKDNDMLKQEGSELPNLGVVIAFFLDFWTTGIEPEVCDHALPWVAVVMDISEKAGLNLDAAFPDTGPTREWTECEDLEDALLEAPPSPSTIEEWKRENGPFYPLFWEVKDWKKPDWSAFWEAYKERQGHEPGGTRHNCEKMGKVERLAFSYGCPLSPDSCSTVD